MSAADSSSKIMASKLPVISNSKKSTSLVPKLPISDSSSASQLLSTNTDSSSSPSSSSSSSSPSSPSSPGDSSSSSPKLTSKSHKLMSFAPRPTQPTPDSKIESEKKAILNYMDDIIKIPKEIRNDASYMNLIQNIATLRIELSK